MKSQKEKMLSGELYFAGDAELTKERMRARELIKKYNSIPEDQTEKLTAVLRDLIPNGGKELVVQPPFFCDYGYNIKTGDSVYFNFNCIILDGMEVSIGDRSMFGPNVQIYTASHPLKAKERASLLEFSKAIEIGDDVWVGGNVTICPGVKIGNRAVIGAGSVVTKDIPDDVFAAGNPCKVIKKIKQ
ncbi:sugar O-acetyltransferase [Zunongwangia sp. HRR-M8]|uniref:sugar O-acetyltransferase n=1 Tax=Zunongwangia sp. HRR-M8 TaxID=3015170 RepID=UPI0022DDCFAC|nr:sugar O-acetyltransferase [Zunongwangia sp. HRR-M8]WBL22945.1 sugar O-acetyltransferase [Zunongwangia sp. HRR-M8]